MPTAWKPTRILVAEGGIPDFTDYLARGRPDLEFRGVAAGQIGAADLEWAQVYVGFRRPPIPGWGGVRWIHSTGAGVDRFLSSDPPPRSVLITRSPEDFGPAIAEWCLARALVINQHVAQQARDQAARFWNRDLEPIMLRGQRVLILGTGLVGRGIARAFSAAGCSVRGLSRSGNPAPDFDQIRPAAEFADAIGGTDWLILAAPSTPETKHFLNRARLSQCGGAYLMNVGRGAVVDEAALPSALDQGWISGAAIDVFEQEPLDPSSPLWNHPKVLVSPHVSGPSTLAGTADGFFECLTAVEKGEPCRWVVDPSRGY